MLVPLCLMKQKQKQKQNNFNVSRGTFKRVSRETIIEGSETNVFNERFI